MKSFSVLLTAATALVSGLAATAPADAGAQRQVVAVEVTGAVVHDPRVHGFYYYRGALYHKGWRGVRTPRHAYLYVGGWWFPPQAFDGLIVAPPRAPVVRYKLVPAARVAPVPVRRCTCR